MLRVDVDQSAAQLFHGLQSHRGVVDEGTAFLLRVEFAAEDAVGLKVKVVRLE